MKTDLNSDPPYEDIINNMDEVNFDKLRELGKNYPIDFEDWELLEAQNTVYLDQIPDEFYDLYMISYRYGVRLQEASPPGTLYTWPPSIKHSNLAIAIHVLGAIHGYYGKQPIDSW